MFLQRFRHSKKNILVVESLLLCRWKQPLAVRFFCCLWRRFGCVWTLRVTQWLLSLRHPLSTLILLHPINYPFSSLFPSLSIFVPLLPPSWASETRWIKNETLLLCFLSVCVWQADKRPDDSRAEKKKGKEKRRRRGGQSSSQRGYGVWERLKVWTSDLK